MTPPRRFRPALSSFYKPSAQSKVLAQWRGVDLAPLEKAGADRARRLSDLVPGVLQRIGLDNRRVEAEITKVWNHALDSAMVAHAQPVNLNRGTLFIQVDNSVWLDELVRYRRRDILRCLQNSFGRDLIVRLSFRIG